MMASFSCLVSFSSLISKFEHDQLFRASYATAGGVPIKKFLGAYYLKHEKMPLCRIRNELCSNEVGS